MAYLREISVRKCCKCSARATVELFNRVNAPQGDYCRKCASRALTQMQKHEDASRDAP